jgi:hypothetical protein
MKPSLRLLKRHDKPVLQYYVLSTCPLLSFVHVDDLEEDVPGITLTLVSLGISGFS